MEFALYCLAAFVVLFGVDYAVALVAAAFIRRQDAKHFEADARALKC